MNKILFLDPSPNATGYAYKKDGKIIKGVFKVNEIYDYEYVPQSSKPIGEEKMKRDNENCTWNDNGIIECIKPTGRSTYWNEDNGKYQKLKRIKNITKVESEVKSRLLFNRLNNLMNKEKFDLLVIEKSGSVPRKFNKKTKQYESNTNIKTLTQQGAVYGILYSLSVLHKLPKIIEVRAQDHQRWVRELMQNKGMQLHFKEKKVGSQISETHDTKKDSKQFASAILKEEIKDDNISDAVCIMFWYEVNGKSRNRKN